jgi:hypothetical protein
MSLEVEVSLPARNFTPLEVYSCCGLTNFVTVSCINEAVCHYILFKVNSVEFVFKCRENRVSTVVILAPFFA